MPARRTLAALLAAGALITACSGDDPAPEPSPSPTASETAAASPSPSEAAPRAPLTATPVDDQAVLDRPAVIVKVENTPAAFPQAGLDVADVVVEELVEGGITRFVAVFHSQVPDVVGPIRSGRLADAEVVPAFRGVMVYSGARDEVNAALRRAGIPLIGEGGPGVFRASDRRAPHNLMGRGPELFAAAAERDGAEPPPAAWTFAESAPDGASTCAAGATDCTDPGERLDVRMSGQNRVGWSYDPDAGVYRRAQNGNPTIVTGEGRIGAANVVVIGTGVGPGGCCDPAGNPLVHTDVVGSGRAIVLRDGKRYEATWSKASAGAQYELTAPDGSPFPLKPGPTWMHLAPAGNLPAA